MPHDHNRLVERLLARDWASLGALRFEAQSQQAWEDWARDLVEAWVAHGHLNDWHEVEKCLPPEGCVALASVGRPRLTMAAQAGRFDHLACLVPSLQVGWGWTDQYELGAHAGVRELMYRALHQLGVFSVQRVLDRAVAREDVAACAMIAPDAPSNRCLDALTQAVKQASWPLIRTLAPRAFSTTDGTSSKAADPFEAAMMAHDWDTLAVLLEHTPPRVVASFDLLVTACREQVPVNLLDRLVRQYPQEQEASDRLGLWGDLFVQATRHAHTGWIEHAWSTGRVSEAQRASAMLTEVAPRHPESLPLLVGLSDQVDFATLLKLTAVGPSRTQLALDRIGVLMPLDRARAMVEQSRSAHHGDLAMTRSRLLAEDRHQQVAQPARPLRSSHRSRS